MLASGITFLCLITPSLQITLAYLYFRKGHIWSAVLNNYVREGHIETALANVPNRISAIKHIVISRLLRYISRRKPLGLEIDSETVL